jgi:hypothetical protein
VRVDPPLRAFLADEYDLQRKAFEIADCKPSPTVCDSG